YHGFSSRLHFHAPELLVSARWSVPCVEILSTALAGCLCRRTTGSAGLGESLADRGLFRDRERDVTAQLAVGDSKNTITLARSSADVSPPYGFMLLPGTTSSGFAMKRSSFSLSHTKSAPFMALE